jgi:hypothetical protein
MISLCENNLLIVYALSADFSFHENIKNNYDCFFFLKKRVFIARVIFVRINFYISLISFKLLLSKYFNRSLIPKLVNFIALVNHTASIRTM